MTLARRAAVAPERCIYGAAVSALRPAADYAARAMAHRDGVAVPLEVDLILWQR